MVGHQSRVLDLLVCVWGGEAFHILLLPIASLWTQTEAAHLLLLLLLQVVVVVVSLSRPRLEKASSHLLRLIYDYVHNNKVILKLDSTNWYRRGFRRQMHLKGGHYRKMMKQ